MQQLVGKIRVIYKHAQILRSFFKTKIAILMTVVAEEEIRSRRTPTSRVQEGWIPIPATLTPPAMVLLAHASSTRTTLSPMLLPIKPSPVKQPCTLNFPQPLEDLSRFKWMPPHGRIINLEPSPPAPTTSTMLFR